MALSILADVQPWIASSTPETLPATQVRVRMMFAVLTAPTVLGDITGNNVIRTTHPTAPHPHLLVPGQSYWWKPFSTLLEGIHGALDTAAHLRVA